MTDPKDTKTVLVAEDDRAIRDLFTTAMELEGWEVVHAADGQEAIDILLANAPDLVVLDMMMPRVQGLEVLQAMSAHPRLHALPVIVCSARESMAEQDMAKDLGATAWLVKPVEVDELLRVVEELTA